MVAVDPLASVGIYPVDVTLGGVDYTVEGQPASEWLVLLLSGELFRILPGWLESEEDQERLLYQIEAGAVTPAELHEVTLDIISVASGRPWWWCVQLISMAGYSNDTWATLHGKILRSGADAKTMPFGAWLDLLYFSMTEKMDEEDKQKFLSQTEVPHPDLGVPIDEESEAEAFAALLQADM